MLIDGDRATFARGVLHFATFAKTTIGRALAHRLRGKFFLVDGTLIAGSHSFYSDIDRVFAAASRNAPSIIFIDDADVIFGGEKESGL